MTRNGHERRANARRRGSSQKRTAHYEVHAHESGQLHRQATPGAGRLSVTGRRLCIVCAHAAHTSTSKQLDSTYRGLYTFCDPQPSCSPPPLSQMSLSIALVGRELEPAARHTASPSNRNGPAAARTHPAVRACTSYDRVPVAAKIRSFDLRCRMARASTGARRRVVRLVWRSLLVHVSVVAVVPAWTDVKRDVAPTRS